MLLITYKLSVDTMKDLYRIKPKVSQGIQLQTQVQTNWFREFLSSAYKS